jgi:hypothetical protein
MSLRKYRSVEDMPSVGWRTPMDPDNLRMAFDLSATAVRLAGRRFPPGVYRYRSVAEAWERRLTWERTAPREP